jgi:cephalosporin-C deacetylase-like acetyl esterase
VIFIHYSLSPAARYPVALEECYMVLAWATNPTNEFLSIDPKRVAVGGDSAGGNLAVAVSCNLNTYLLSSCLSHTFFFNLQYLLNSGNYQTQSRPTFYFIPSAMLNSILALIASLTQVQV